MQASVADDVRLKLESLATGINGLHIRFAVAPGLPFGIKYWPFPYLLLKVSFAAGI